MFQTKVDIPISPLKITHNSPIISLGSCFAENIGNKLLNAGFDIDVNPFGVLFNPISIQNSLEILLDQKQFTEDDIFEHNGMWQSFSHSSLYSDSVAINCLDKINQRLEKAAQQLKNCDLLLLTLGTAWVFEYNASGKIVSNCHKLPASEFTRRRLTVEEIVEAYTLLINKLLLIKPDLQLIFSVSPVRHWKDGAHDNNLSKSTLHLAIDNLQKKFSQVHYFPAYEIQMDELRDYRFYASDMVHPSEVAVNYIWERFSDTFFNADTNTIKSEVEQLQRDEAHRPLHPNSQEFQKFSDHIAKRKLSLVQKYPFLASRI